MRVRFYMLINNSLVLFLKSVPTLICVEIPFLKYLLSLLSMFLLPSQTHILLQRSDLWDMLPGFHSSRRPISHNSLSLFFFLYNPRGDWLTGRTVTAMMI